MGVPKERLMRINKDGTQEQVYPLTHIDAVKGLEDVIKGGQLITGVKTINGKSGDINIPVLDGQEHDGLIDMLEAYEKGEISGNSEITMEKVGEV